MKKLTTIQLEEIFKAKINRRQTIDDTKLDRHVERLEFPERNILIKYGWDTAIAKEISIYEKVLNNYQQHPVPQLYLKKKVGDIYLLAIEWIDGIHPDFENTTHIEKVFTSLGRWAIDWSHIIKDYNYLKKEPFTNFEDLNHFLVNNRDILTHILGDSSINLLNHCLLISRGIIENIKKMPLTLNPGDISLHNFIINDEGNVIFIDFESCTVSPMISLVEHLGENYESIPNKEDTVHLALQSYLNSWNEVAADEIEWDDFIYSQLCARIYYKMGDFNYWIKRILENKNVEQTLEWINHGKEQLQTLLLNYMTNNDQAKS